MPLLIGVLVLAGTARVGLHTVWGQHLDHVLTGFVAWPRPGPRQALETVMRADLGLLAAGATVCLGSAARRRQWRRVTLAPLVAAGALASTEVLKLSVFDRPDWGFGVVNGLPSGHLTMALCLVLVALLVGPARWRRKIVLLAVAGSSVMATGLLGARWHRPSDLVAACAVVVAWAGVAVLLQRWTAVDGLGKSDPGVQPDLAKGEDVSPGAAAPAAAATALPPGAAVQAGAAVPPGVTGALASGAALPATATGAPVPGATAALLPWRALVGAGALGVLVVLLAGARPAPSWWALVPALSVLELLALAAGGVVALMAWATQGLPDDVTESTSAQRPHGHEGGVARSGRSGPADEEPGEQDGEQDDEERAPDGPAARRLEARGPSSVPSRGPASGDGHDGSYESATAGRRGRGTAP